MARVESEEPIIHRGGYPMPTPVHSVGELAAQVAQDPQLRDQIKEDPVTTISNLALPLQNDVWLYRTVVGALGLVILVAIIGAIVLGAMGMNIPDVVTALGSAAV